jgi:hypothetical protein
MILLKRLATDDGCEVSEPERGIGTSRRQGPTRLSPRLEEPLTSWSVPKLATGSVCPGVRGARKPNEDRSSELMSRDPAGAVLAGECAE